LGVRYVLGGSIRKVGNRVRITGQLIEATTGRHLWADRFDGELADIFELQDRITESVVGAIEPSLRNAEIERAQTKPTESLDAYDLYLRALPHAYSMSRSGLDEAISYLRRAYSLDPRFALAKAFTTYFQVVRKAQGWDQPGDIEEGINLARELAHNARDDALVARCVGLALAYLARDYDAALATVQRALELNSNSAQVVSSAAFVHVYVGRHQEALELFRRAMRLNPRDPEGGYTWGGVASSLLALDRLEEALDAARRSVQEMPTYTTGHRMITIALARLGRVDEARQSAKRLLELTPDYSLSRAKHFMGSAYASGSVERYLAALRLAGIPE
jgi:adenylate cyclase